MKPTARSISLAFRPTFPLPRPSANLQESQPFTHLHGQLPCFLAALSRFHGLPRPGRLSVRLESPK